MILLRNFVLILLVSYLPMKGYAKLLPAKNLYELSTSIHAQYVSPLPESFRKVPVKKAKLTKNTLSFYVQATYVHIRWDKEVSKLWINGQLVKKKTIEDKVALKKKLRKIFKVRKRHASVVESLFFPQAHAFFGLFSGFLSSFTSFIQRMFSGIGRLFSRNSNPPIDNNDESLENTEDELDSSEENGEEELEEENSENEEEAPIEEDSEEENSEATENKNKQDRRKDVLDRCAGMKRIACSIHKRVNLERKKRGRRALKPNRACSIAAQKHAEDMARKSYFSHTGRDGSSPSSRVRRVIRKEGTIPVMSVGENIAWSGGTMSLDPVKTPVNGWLNSPGHFRNMMDRSWTHSGVGVAKRGNQSYEVQIFCKYRTSRPMPITRSIFSNFFRRFR